MYVYGTCMRVKCLEEEEKREREVVDGFVAAKERLPSKVLVEY